MKRSASTIRLVKVSTLGRVTAAVLCSVSGWCSASIDWQDEWSATVQGQRVTIQTFTSAMPPDTTAIELSRQNTVYDRYLVAEGRILLSGVASGAHWLAQIQGQPEGAEGYVSALYVDHDASARHDSQFEAGNHSGALRVFDFGEGAAVGLLAQGSGSSAAQTFQATVGQGRAPVVMLTDPQQPMSVALSVPER